MQGILDVFGLEAAIDDLRVLCGLFLLPHLVVKFRSREFVKGFFADAGMNPPMFWLWSALAVEVVCSTALIFDICSHLAALLAGVFLLAASWASWRVSKGKWMWNFGGAEYPLFWATCCFIVAGDAALAQF
jgi:putative oxidoreductase